MLLIVLTSGITFASSGFITRTGSFFIISRIYYDEAGQNASVVTRGEPVNLYAHWISSSPLGLAVLSTNETGLWKNHTAGEYGSFQNITGYSCWSNFTWTNSSITETNVSWRIYANDTDNNTNVTEVFTFAVVNSTTTTTSTTTTISGGGGGGGPGKSGHEEDINFTVIPDLIKIVIRQGETLTKEVRVVNTGNEKINIAVSQEGLGDMLLFESRNISLIPGQVKPMKLVFTASENQEPDVYLGRIIFEGYGIERWVLVVIEAKEKKPLFDVIVEIPEGMKKLTAGEEVTASVEVINMGDVILSDVMFHYSIRDMEGNIFNSREETLAVEKSKIMDRKLRIPDDMEPGRYIMYVRIDYEGNVAAASDLFQVVLESERPDTASKFYIMIAALAVICLILFAKIIYDLNERRKRYVHKIKWSPEDTNIDNVQKIREKYPERKVLEYKRTEEKDRYFTRIKTRIKKRREFKEED